MERYEFREGSSHKFWEVSVNGDELTVRFGKIGTAGQTKTKTFASAAAAEKEKSKLIKEKTGKGYVAAGSTALLEARSNMSITGTPWAMASSTERVCRTLAPCDAISSISS